MAREDIWLTSKVGGPRVGFRQYTDARCSCGTGFMLQRMSSLSSTKPSPTYRLTI